MNDSGTTEIYTLSLHDALPISADPSVISTKGLGIEVEATPERLSVVVKLKETSVLFHPAALAHKFTAQKLSLPVILSIIFRFTVAVKCAFSPLPAPAPHASSVL